MQTLFFLLSFLPLWLLHGLGWALGWLVFLCSARYRQRFAANAALAGVAPAAQRRAVGEAGKMVAELPRLWRGAPVPVQWRGAEWVQSALDAGQAIVCVTPHLGCFEITAQAYAARFGARAPMTVLFRPPRQAWLQRIVAAARIRPGLQTAPTTLAGVKLLLHALKRGQCVGLLPDQVPPQGQGVWAPFFGQAAYTMTLAQRLARQPQTCVLLAWGERLSWGRGFVVHVQPMPAPLDADPLCAATQMNQAMEALVRQAPHQYLWGYARYKPARDSG